MEREEKNQCKHKENLSKSNNNPNFQRNMFFFLGCFGIILRLNVACLHLTNKQFSTATMHHNRTNQRTLLSLNIIRLPDKVYNENRVYLFNMPLLLLLPSTSFALVPYFIVNHISLVHQCLNSLNISSRSTCACDVSLYMARERERDRERTDNGNKVFVVFEFNHKRGPPSISQKKKKTNPMKSSSNCVMCWSHKIV